MASPAVRFYTSSDYPVLCKWWNAKQFPPPPEPMLPRVGVVVENVCAGFLYATDSKIAWAEWIIGNPEAPKDLRSEGLDTLLTNLCECAKALGFEVVFTSSNHPRLMDRLCKAGFVKTDENVTQLVRRF